MYCGTGHSIMLAKCIVARPGGFRFVDGPPDCLGTADVYYVARGKELAGSMGCATCHSIDGTKMTGPTWKDLYGCAGSPDHWTAGYR